MSAYTYPGLITPEKIITVICDMLHVTEPELRGDKRRQTIVDARRITVKEIRRRTKVPYADIGRLLNKHHASMMYLEKSYDELLTNHAPFRIKAKHVEQKLNEYFTPNN